MRTIIAGSRGASYDDVLMAINSCPWGDLITSVVSGNARGADRFGEAWAREMGYGVALFQADWDRHGRSAGPRRNRDMARNADALIAVWDGDSRGTANMIETARDAGLRVFVFRTDYEAA